MPALPSLVELVPMLGVGVGDIGGFSSSYIPEKVKKKRSISSFEEETCTYQKINNQAYAVYGERGAAAFNFVSEGFFSSKASGISDVILVGVADFCKSPVS